MLVLFPKEFGEREKRIAILPEVVAKYRDLGIDVGIEHGLGEGLNLSDEAFKTSGATVFTDITAGLKAADVVVSLNKPDLASVGLLRVGGIYISFLDPFVETALIDKFSEQQVSSISMEMIPRITVAQKMDALSSQANLAGYAAVIQAQANLPKAFPMMVTAAGTIQPCRVFVIGVGVAGLQAIATAKRLGAQVEAFDTRPETKEQVQSLGAKFVSIDLGATGRTKDGYAKALTSEQITKQREQMTKVCSRADVIITTAKVFGRKSPLLITKEMLAKIQPGTIIVDMAVASGGNVEGSVCGRDIVINGVKIIGYPDLADTLAVHASQMYANNILHLVKHFWQDNTFQISPTDEIMQACLITHKGNVVNPKLAERQLAGVS